MQNGRQVRPVVCPIVDRDTRHLPFRPSDNAFGERMHLLDQSVVKPRQEATQGAKLRSKRSVHVPTPLFTPTEPSRVNMQSRQRLSAIGPFLRKLCCVCVLSVPSAIAEIIPEPPSTIAESASSEESDTLLASQRFHYQKAKLALANKKHGVYQHHYKEMGDYPLKQYLEFSEIRNNLSNLPFDKIDGFFSSYPQSFLEARLRIDLLHILAARKQWQDYSRYYDSSLTSTILRCHNLYARATTGDKAAFDDVTAIWTIGKSQPNACDPLFKLWRTAGYQTEDNVWARFHDAMQRRDIRFARYLSTLLTERKALAELYLDVHQKPSLITQRHLFQARELPSQQIIAHGVKLLAQRKPLDALYQWELYEAQQMFPDDLIVETKRHVVKRLIRTGHAKEAQQLLNYSHSLREQGLVEEIIREALAEQDWQRVAASIALLDEESQQSERWQYWQARVREELNPDSVGQSVNTDVYQTLAENRSFYGFLSSDKLQKAYSLVDDTQPLERNLMDQVAQLSGMRRARELSLTGNETEARAEWLYVSRLMDTQQLLAAGQLAREWGWHNSGIQAMINGNLWNQLTVRFPLAYREQIHQIATDTQVAATLIYAVARQESAFNERARSPVGAMGLMQIMPQTAIFTAKKSGLKHSTSNDLLDAEHNMRLGSHYLNYLLDKFNGNRILAAAAYNAGPSRVNRWLSEQGKERPFDVWIETIPYKETRHYVQNVLCFSVIYGYRLGEQTPFISPEEAGRYL